MTKSTIIFIITLALITAVLGYNYFATPLLNRWEKITETKPEEVVAPVAQPTQTPQEVALAKLSSAQKVAQLIAFPYQVSKSSGETAKVITDPNLWSAQDQSLAQFQPGVVVLFGSQISTQSAQLAINQIQRDLKTATLRPLIAVDHEGGVVQRLNGVGFTKLPAWQTACQLPEAELKRLVLDSSLELAKVGVNIVLGPVVDLSQHSVWQHRTCATSEEVLPAAQLFIEIMAKAKIMAVVKHFPGLGTVSVDLHQQPATIDLDADQIQVFADLFDRYPNIGVMTGHVKITDRYDNLPCSLSAACLANFDNYYQEMLVFSDSLSMKSVLTADTSLAQLVIQAKKAGNDILIIGEQISASSAAELLTDLTSAYENDQEFKKSVDASLKQIINLKSLTTENND